MQCNNKNKAYQHGQNINEQEKTSFKMSFFLILDASIFGKITIKTIKATPLLRGFTAHIKILHEVDGTISLQLFYIVHRRWTLEKESNWTNGPGKIKNNWPHCIFPSNLIGCYLLSLDMQ